MLRRNISYIVIAFVLVILLVAYAFHKNAAVGLATIILAVATFYLANETKSVSSLTEKNLEQQERHHKETFRPFCLITTHDNQSIAEFGSVIGLGASVLHEINLKENIDRKSYIIFLSIVNKGQGPAINVRFHINNMARERITKDFLVAHIIQPSEIVGFLSEIPETRSEIEAGHPFVYNIKDVVDNAYYLVCEFESIFSGDSFHSIVAKGYLDPFLASDGKNQWRLNRPLTPLVEFKSGLDPARPTWPIPPDDAVYPGESLNFPEQSNKGHAD